MGVLNLIDRYSSTLSGAYTSGGGSLSVTSASGLPTGACNFFVIVKAEGANTEEVFLVSSISGTTLTVTGAQANSSASNHASGATIVGGIVTSAFVQQLGLVLLEEQTASSSAELDFTTCITSTYDEYQIELVSIIPATNAVSILMQVHAGGGYDTGNNYSYAFYRQSGGGQAAGGNLTSSFDLTAGGTESNSTNTGVFCATIKLYSPGNGVSYPRIISDGANWDASGNPDIRSILTGSYRSATAVDGFRIKASSGNLASGIVRAYGFAK